MPPIWARKCNTQSTPQWARFSSSRRSKPIHLRGETVCLSGSSKSRPALFQPDQRILQSVFHHQGRTLRVPSDEWLTLFETEGFAAAIFDCDGTLVDSKQAHFQAMQSAAQEQGHEMEPYWYCKRTGLDRRSLFKDFQQTVPDRFDIENAITTSIARFSGFAHLIKPMSAVLEFAGALRQRGIPLAVATNAERAVANVSLSAVNANTLFDHVVSISDDVRPKPSPEIFERAAHLLGQAPNKTLVVEDSPQGVQASTTANMSAIQLLDY